LKDLGDGVTHLDSTENFESLDPSDASACEVAVADVQRRIELEIVSRVYSVRFHHIIQNDSFTT
jgi:flagellar biosynthesis regulator FlbT